MCIVRTYMYVLYSVYKSARNVLLLIMKSTKVQSPRHFCQMHELHFTVHTYMYVLYTCTCTCMYIFDIKGAIARVVRVRTGNGPMALVNIMFPLWSCSHLLITAMLHKEDGEVLYSSYTLNNAHFRRTRNNS